MPDTQSADTNPSAQHVVHTMFARDNTAQALGIQLLDCGPGYAKLSMVVRDDMISGVFMGHGGMTFTLADTAFAYACNAGNHKTVAHQCSINFIRPALLGDTLFATCQEVTRQRQTGIYDVEIMNQNNQRVALFRGNAFQIKGHIVEPGDEG